MKLDNLCHSITSVVMVKATCGPVLVVGKENINKTNNCAIQSGTIVTGRILFRRKCNTAPIGSIGFHRISCQLVLPNHTQAKQKAKTVIIPLQNNIPAAIRM